MTEIIFYDNQSDARNDFNRISKICPNAKIRTVSSDEIEISLPNVTDNQLDKIIDLQLNAIDATF